MKNRYKCPTPKGLRSRIMRPRKLKVKKVDSTMWTGHRAISAKQLDWDLENLGSASVKI